METIDNLTTLLATIFTVLFSAGAWKFYESRLKLKNRDIQNEKNEQNMYRDDLRDRVKRLEKLLTESSLEKDQMRDLILNLTREVSELRVKVTFLEKENERLKNK